MKDADFPPGLAVIVHLFFLWLVVLWHGTAFYGSKRLFMVGVLCGHADITVRVDRLSRYHSGFMMK